MTKKWKPTADEKRAVRAYAAKAEGLKPGQIAIQLGERYSLTSGKRSENILLISDDPKWNDTDLHDNGHAWADHCKWGIELTEDGRALVDLYIYEKLFDDHGDLMSNVQCHVETVDGKPRLVKLTGTLTPPVEGEALTRLMEKATA